MKKITNEFLENPRDSLVFSFKDSQNDNQTKKEKSLSDQYVNEDLSILGNTQEEVIINGEEKVDINVSSSNLETDTITSLLAKNIKSNEYRNKYAFILKYGYEAYLTSKKRKL